MTSPRIFLAALILWIVLIAPNDPGMINPAALLALPLELPVILLALALARGAWVTALRGVFVAVLVLLTLLKAADMALFTAFSRPFNPVADLPLVAAGWNLGSGSAGTPMAALAVVAALGIVALLAAALWWATGQWAGRHASPSRHAGLTLGLAASAALMLGDMAEALSSPNLAADTPASASIARYAVRKADTVWRTLADLGAFRRAAAADPWVNRAAALDRLRNRDTIILFLESYGRASFDAPLYAPAHTATLRAAEPALAAAGLATRSGWLTSPIAGGQSWLAHGTFAGGLMIDGQIRYDALLQSPRRTLFHLARDTGLRTAAIMPAITMPWPEGRRLGFGTVLSAADLGYRGKAFNWVTMPDQFTLAAFDRLVARGNLFAQIALISSHAPWTPVPDLLPWGAIADGTEFDVIATSGDPPQVVWRDRDRVRDQYRRSISYTLRTVMSWAARQSEDPPLMVILGDHPPAAFVSLIDSRDVPVHVIGPPDLVARFDAFGWTPGLIPDPATLPLPMESFRDRFLSAFTSGATQ